MESTVGDLSVQGKGLAKSAETQAADIVELQAYVQTANVSQADLDATLEQLQNDVIVLQRSNGGLQAQLSDANAKIDKVIDANTKLVAALKASSRVSVPGIKAEPTADEDFAPQVEGYSGGINLKLQAGRHATVNGKMVLTADEIATLISDAVANALKAVGNALDE